MLAQYFLQRRNGRDVIFKTLITMYKLCTPYHTYIDFKHVHSKKKKKNMVLHRIWNLGRCLWQAYSDRGNNYNSLHCNRNRKYPFWKSCKKQDMHHKQFHNLSFCGNHKAFAHHTKLITSFLQLYNMYALHIWPEENCWYLCLWGGNNISTFSNLNFLNSHKKLNSVIIS